MSTSQARRGGLNETEPRPVAVRRRPAALWRHTFTGSMLLPGDSAEPLLIDERGAIIWNLIGEYRTLEQLVDLLAADFAAERTTIQADTQVFLEELARHGLVEWTTSR